MLLIIAIAILLLPIDALAFGPLVHIDTGLQVIAEVAGICGGVFALIQRHRQAFLRGTLGPDRQVAKSLAPYLKHSHNWHRAFALYYQANDDEQRAFFLGYLCHLAADTVSHNYFVPMMVLESYKTRFTSHVYWEMRLDARASSREALKTIRSLKLNEKEHRLFLARVVPGYVFGPRFNIRMTGLAMRLQRASAFRIASLIVDRGSKIQISQKETDDVRRLAVEAQLLLLKKLDRAQVIELDPRGMAAIAVARRVRKELRAMLRAKSNTEPVARKWRDYLRGIVVAALHGQSKISDSSKIVNKRRRAA